jgi:hypothetical protein
VRGGVVTERQGGAARATGRLASIATAWSPGETIAKIPPGAQSVCEAHSDGGQ